jgi:antitoxin (DNA-binding transcriptional repressor) of toxin-antitoxin stability system
MEKISTIDVRQRIGDLLNRVALRHDEFVIERKGKPLAAPVPVERLEQMDASQDGTRWNSSRNRSKAR